MNPGKLTTPQAVSLLKGGPGPRDSARPRWPVYHADFDKAHRCPAMLAGWHEGLSYHVSSEKTGWTFRWTRVYSCGGCGLKVALWPLLPVFPSEWHVFSGHVTWGQRARWFWIRNPRRWLEWHPRWLHRQLRRIGRDR